MVKSKGFKLHETWWGQIIITIAAGLILSVIIPNPITSKITKLYKPNNQSIDNSHKNIQIQNNIRKHKYKAK